VTVALELKALLDEAGLYAVVKTSGKTGLHVLVPIERNVTFAEARAIAHAFGQHLAAAHPKLVTLEQSTLRRRDRIFFDYTMNAQVKTLISPYSVRGLLGAPGAMPVTWDELPHISPADFTLETVPRLVQVQGDIWETLLHEKQDLRDAIRTPSRP